MDQKHITSLAQPLALFSGAQPLAPPHIAYLSHSFMINVKSMIIAFPTTLLKHHNTMGSDDYAALLKLAESSSSRPELLKTHKERVEELNTYLSRLSEHHDMPRIGPG
ncbi:hypothetical protein RAB80_006023 [Fusarium oxysporum f. sp. vasinfectum]|nr:hypothetical protein RAB80_006023 [Fusarium oxysporum f. sp. vasinfectum]